MQHLSLPLLVALLLLTKCCAGQAQPQWQLATLIPFTPVRAHLLCNMLSSCPLQRLLLLCDCFSGGTNSRNFAVAGHDAARLARTWSYTHMFYTQHLPGAQWDADTNGTTADTHGLTAVSSTLCMS